jgi:hypothetical protein
MNESFESLTAQLRRMSDKAGDQIDADRLASAADVIESLRRERDDLQSFIKGIAANVNAMLKPIGGE